jgi:hypothetical protein
MHGITELSNPNQTPFCHGTFLPPLHASPLGYTTRQLAGSGTEAPNRTAHMSPGCQPFGTKPHSTLQRLEYFPVVGCPCECEEASVIS